jgi:hypothetical protein
MHHHVAQPGLVGHALISPYETPLVVHARGAAEDHLLARRQAAPHRVLRPQHEGLDLGGVVAQLLGAPGHLQRRGAELHLLLEAGLEELELEGIGGLRRQRAERGLRPGRARAGRTRTRHHPQRAQGLESSMPGPG